MNFAGGLHHAMPGGASGFCVYNDAALAVARLLELGAERVAYVDVDVHHGDGVQAAFWDDPRVLTISLHEHPRTLFPQTGWPQETGGAGAEGSAVNVALPAGTGDAGWLRAFHAVVPELLAAFRPQVLVTQHGADTHFEDPLAHLAVTPGRAARGGRAPATSWRTSTRTGAGWRWAAAGTRWRTWCRGPGRIWWADRGRAPVRAGDGDAARSGGARCCARTRTAGAAPDDRRPWTRGGGLRRAGTTRRTGWTRRCWRPAGRCSRCTGCFP